MTFTEDELAAVVTEAIGIAIAPLVERLKALETRFKDIETRGLIHKGTWDSLTVYRPGDVVTWSGSAWHCNELHSGGRPGASPSWNILAQRGREGKPGAR